MSYDQLRTLSFRLGEGQAPEVHSFFILKFPEAWKNKLKNLQGELKKRPPDKVNLPIASLNKAMRALVPDLIYINKKAGQIGVQPWLYTVQAIEPTALYLIIHAWVKTEFSKASDSQLKQIFSQMSVEDLAWEQTNLDITAWTTASNGTAKPSNPDSFILLPHVLAAKLSQDNIVIEYGAESLRFRRAPLSVGTQGAELVSWKPLEYQGYYWSVVVTFTIQTVPFQHFPVIHCDLSLRRWVSVEDTKLPPETETSVYLLTEVPWLEGLPYSNSFQVAPIGWQRVSASEQKKTPYSKQFTWGSQLTTLLDKLNPQHRFPDPRQILADPVSALNFNGTPHAAVTYRNGIEPEHRVGPGLGPADRRQIAEQIAELLAPQLEWVEPLERVKFKKDYVPKILDLPKPKKEFTEFHQENLLLAQSQIRKGIQETLMGSDRLTVEIWYQREKTQETLLQGIRYCLGIPESVSWPYHFQESGLVINVCFKRLGSLGDRLNLDSNLKNRKDRLTQAINQRSQQVQQAITPTSGVTVALVEISPKNEFDRNTDPKSALRRGFASANRLTQFIATDNPNLSHSSITAFLDLLRQLGVQMEPPKIEISLPTSKNKARNKSTEKHSNCVPQPLNYVGVWLIKRYSQTSPDGTVQIVPVMVHLASNTTEIKAKALGFDGWLSYREALVEIARGDKVRGVARLEQALPFIEQTLRSDVLPLGDTLLLCHAQNLRAKAWEWLQNGKIGQDCVTFGIQKPSPIQQFKGLRIVRIRDNQSHETPEWYAEDEDEQGFSAGIFKMGERVFASTYNKPNQFKKLSVNLSKAATWTTKKGKTFEPSPDTYFWNPGLVELTVACIQPGDEAFSWAALTHELRHLALQFDEPLKLPLPLHLAKQMEEYITLIDVEDEE